MKKLLLCPPDFYTVDYEINPWMHVREKPDQKKAAKQWQALFETLSGLGVEVSLIDPVQGLPDMVFTANGGLVAGERFILSNFRHKERRREAEHFRRWFEARGLEVVALPGDCVFEGEGDALAFPPDTGDTSNTPGTLNTGDTLVAGFRFRSDIQSHNLVGEVLGKKVVSVELASPDFYHLDTCFCPLSEGSAMYFPDAFDEYGVKALTRLVPDLIELTPEDASHFCCNAVVLGTDIVMNRCSDALRGTLRDRGFTTHELDFSEFIKSGGSAKCLALKLD